MLEVINDIAPHGAAAGVVRARGVAAAPSPPGLARQIADLVRARGAGTGFRQELKDAVRDMLRAGGFKPSGRSKPASEYLLRAAEQGDFPAINNLVDINNLLSLQSGLPVSLLDAAETSHRIRLRYGLDGESYVFNQAGQVIDLKGLICVCRAEPPPGLPLGTPVKDSMQGKIKEHTHEVIGVIYAPRAALGAGELGKLTEDFAQLLLQYGGAAECETALA